MKYKLGNPEGMTMDQIIDLGNNEHFSKLTCSIIPTIDYWKDENNKILTDLINKDCDICFEYPVSSISKATSSYTDIMLISGDTAIAVESKWNEPTGCLCENQNSKRKDEVQRHWIGIISKFLNKSLFLEDFSKIEYQLLHRTASACSLDKKYCKIVYQIFYVNTLKDSFVNEIKKIQALLADQRIEFYVDAVKIEFTVIYETLLKEISKLDKTDRINKIKSTIKENELFKFSEENLYKIEL